MEAPLRPPEPIFGVVPPEGTCRVRLKLVMKRKGNTPVVMCDDVNQEAMQAAIDQSKSLKHYLEYIEEELGPRPWELRGKLEFLGFDGGAILAPAEIEFLYYGQKQHQLDAMGVIARAMEMQQQVFLAREQTRQVELQTMAQVRATELQAQAEARKVELTAQAELYKAAVSQTPNEHLVRELAIVRAAESDRADKATGDVMKALKLGGATKPQKDFMDLAVQGTQLWPAAKDALAFFFKKGLPN